MAKKRRLLICEIKQHSQGNLSNGSLHETQSRGVSQPIHPHGSSHPTHFDDPLQTAQVPRASQPHCLPRTSRLSSVDVHASERFQVNDQPMDKTWMTKSRLSREYMQGIIGFLDFASRNVSKEGTISCPCVRCVNSFMLSLDVVHDHLFSFGICQGYNYWYCHGENISAATPSNICETPVEQTGLQFGDMEEMLHDIFHMQSQSSNEIRDETHEVEPFSQVPSEQPMQEPNENAQRFCNLLKDAKQPLYEGCKTFSKLSAIVHWYHLKCLKGLSNETFTLILQTLKAMLPPDAKLPKDCYEAKKIIKDLGLVYEKIHACHKGCIKGSIFWSPNDVYSQVIPTREWSGRVRGCGFGPTPKSSGSTSFNSQRFDVVDEEERMRDKETIRRLEEKAEANAVEMRCLKEQVAMLMRLNGVQARDGCYNLDQASPEAHQRSSCASHDMERSNQGNRTV